MTNETMKELADRLAQLNNHSFIDRVYQECFGDEPVTIAPLPSDADLPDTPQLTALTEAITGAEERMQTTDWIVLMKRQIYGEQF